ANRLTFTLDKEAAYQTAEVIFICVGTPTGEDGSADLQYVLAAARDVGAVIKALGPEQKPKIVVVKSTVPVGTTHKVRDAIREIVGPDVPFAVADNPEFLKEGAAVRDFNYPDRVILGVDDEETGVVLRQLYEPFVRSGNPIMVMDVLSAEMVKYASNNFLATKISYINEMAALCEAYGADVERVRRGMSADPRIGGKFLYPGLGYGGSCFPKDTRACIAMGEAKGVSTPLSQAVNDVNVMQRTRFFAKICSQFGEDLQGLKLAFWGIAFKPNTDDIREAPAITLMECCQRAGATCVAFDPVASENCARQHPGLCALVGNMYEAVEGADAVVVSTDWDEFKSPDFARMKSLMRTPVVFDGRNLYSTA
ncbi:MAG: UDP-glucose/GDP-mannose dehydrogenase family protein, partial [Planctomycetota bacterium]|nr:UDP-glucose/GDP-mannose dehydrogenase family protein [Planctomycetota bacterium]